MLNKHKNLIKKVVLAALCMLMVFLLCLPVRVMASDETALYSGLNRFTNPLSDSYPYQSFSYDIETDAAITYISFLRENFITFIIVVVIVVSIITFLLLLNISARIKLRKINKVLKKNHVILIDALDQAQKATDTVNAVHMALGSAAWECEFDENCELIRVRWSNEMRSMLGYEGIHDFPDILDSWIDTMHPADRQNVLEDFWNTVKDASDRVTFDVIYRLNLKKGDFKWFRAVGKLTGVNKGSSRIFYGLLMDINEQIVSEHNLKKARDNAQRANAAKTEFLFNMSHDMRTPMNAIVGYTELLQTKGLDSEEASGYLDKIKKSGEYMASVVNDVLDMTKIEVEAVLLNESVFDIAEVSSGVFDIFEDEINSKHLITEKTFDVKHRYVLADRAKILRILVNILSNAVKFNSDEGRICMHIKETVCDERDKAWYEISIEDSGIGMDKEFIERIFQMFTKERNSTQSGQKGTGLGLSIVKRYIDFMGGTIDFTSSPGKGTLCTVKLKLKTACNPKESEGIEESETDRYSALNNKRILMAEDNALNAEIIISILEEEKIAVEWAHDGVECVNMINAKDPGYYDLVLMDIQMPVMNGYEAAKNIRKMDDAQKANIPIAAMTANAFEEDRKRAFEAGMNAHLSKPVDVKIIMETLLDLISHMETEK